MHDRPERAEVLILSNLTREHGESYEQFIERLGKASMKLVGPTCQGGTWCDCQHKTRLQAARATRPCPRCRGLGKLLRRVNEGVYQYPVNLSSNHPLGLAEIGPPDCLHCAGTGEVAL